MPNSRKNIEIKAFVGLLCLVGALRGTQQSLQELWVTDKDGVEKFSLVGESEKLQVPKQKPRVYIGDTCDKLRSCLGREIRRVMGHLVFSLHKQECSFHSAFKVVNHFLKNLLLSSGTT